MGGCMVIELLTGAPPLGERSAVEAAYGMVEEGPHLPASISYAMRSFLQLCFHAQGWCRPSANELLSHPVFRPLSGDDDLPETGHDEDEDENEDDDDADDHDHNEDDKNASPDSSDPSPSSDGPSSSS